MTVNRNLSPHLDRFGNIRVDVTIGAQPDDRQTGANAPPATVARFLRELADDIERAGSLPSTHSTIGNLDEPFPEAVCTGTSRAAK